MDEAAVHQRQDADNADEEADEECGQNF